LKSGKKSREKAFLVTWLDKKEKRKEKKRREEKAGSCNACDVIV
jgi:hypothetical protein